MKHISCVLIFVILVLSIVYPPTIRTAEASAANELVLNELGSAPGKCTLDESVTLDGSPTAKWLTKGLDSQVTLSVNADVSAYVALKVQLYSPKATDDYIGLQIMDADSYSIKGIKVDWEGWKTIEYKTSDMTNTDLENLVVVTLWDHGWTYTYGDANADSDKNGSMNIGKIWFSPYEAHDHESAVVDMNTYSSSYPTTDAYTKLASKTIAWTDQVSLSHLDFANPGVTDFTGYSHLTFWMYSEKATDSELLIGLESSGGYYSYKIYIDFAGWKQFKLPIDKFTKISDGDLTSVSKMWMYATGWNMTPNSETKIYIDTILAETLPQIEDYGITSGKYPLVDLDSYSGSYPTSTAVTKTATKSIAWTDQVSTMHLDFNSPLITDWTGFTHLSVWVYSEKATGSECLIGAVKEKDGAEDGYFTYSFNVDFTGWKQIIFPIGSYTKSDIKIKRVWMYATGWGMTPNPETSVYIDSIYLENNSAPEAVQTSLLSYDAIDEIKTLAESFVFWHNGDSSIVRYGSLTDLSEPNSYIVRNGAAYMPSAYWQNALGMTVSGSSLTFEGKTAEFDTITSDSEVYFPLHKAAEEFGLDWVHDDGIVVVSKQSLDAYRNSHLKNAVNLLLCTRLTDISDITSADFEALALKWQNYLTGNSYSGNAYIDQTKAAYSNTALNLLSSMGTPDLAAPGSDGTYILGYWNKAIVSTADMNVQFDNLYQMALGYSTEGTNAYKNEELKTAIFEILDWLYENIYGIDEMNNTGWRDTTLFNWHQWQIGVPNDLTKTLLLMRDEFSEEDISKYLEVTDHFTDYASGSGTNLIDTLIPRFISCILREDAGEFMSMKSFLEADMAYQTKSNGHGIYRDGSYKYHYYYAMNGTYGSGYLGAVSELLYLFEESPFELSGHNIDNYISWLFKGYIPTLFEGRMMTMFRGRSPGGEVDVGKEIVTPMLLLTGYMNSEQKEKALPWLKYQIEASGMTAYGMSFPSIIKYNELMENKSITADDSEPVFNSYYVTDKAVWKNGSNAVAISMSSSRTSGWESINGQNLTGWYQGDGVTYVYDSSTDNFSSAYFKYADPYMLPGTTVDSQERVASSIRDSEVYQSSKDFVGSLSIASRYGASAMHLESYHSEGGTTVTDYGSSPPTHDNDLVAKKSWFAFDNELVCLGTEINSTMSSEVKTVIENRIDSSGQITTKNGALTLSGEDDISDGAYAHIDGTAGYVFASGQMVKASTETNNRTFTKLWITHGENPENADYAYTILPGASLEETDSYSANPDAEILINSPGVQAVRDKSTGITSYVFWEAGTFDGVTVSEPMILSKAKTGSKITLWVCDPTQKLENATVIISTDYGEQSIDFDFPSERGDTLELEVLEDAPVEAYVNEAFGESELAITNNTNESVTLYVFFAGYSDITLTEITHLLVTIEAGKTFTADCPAIADGKVFIWQSKPMLLPLYKPLSERRMQK